jgi:protein-tyrosine phosphatase
MLDIHCHILPDVDDGPVDLDEALELARFAVADGITHVVATPHCHRDLRMLRDDVNRHVARLRRDLARAGIPLTIFPGAEIQCYDVPLYRRDHEAGLYCHFGDDRRYTLMEFPWNDWLYPADAAEHIAWLVERGTTPIIAHPERHNYFRDHLPRLQQLIAAGAWAQLTPDSLLGNHGPHAREAAEEMLGAVREVVLATDAHAVGRRCSGLAIGYRLVAEMAGQERADEIRARSDQILQHLLRVDPGAVQPSNGPGGSASNGQPASR